jgi:hypothetical protein
MRLEEFKNFEEAEKFFWEVGYSQQFFTILEIIKMEWKDESQTKTAERFLKYWNRRLAQTPCRPSLKDYSAGFVLTMYLINELREV